MKNGVTNLVFSKWSVYRQNGNINSNDGFEAKSKCLLDRRDRIGCEKDNL